MKKKILTKEIIKLSQRSIEKHPPMPVHHLSRVRYLRRALINMNKVVEKYDVSDEVTSEFMPHFIHAIRAIEEIHLDNRKIIQQRDAILQRTEQFVIDVNFKITSTNTLLDKLIDVNNNLIKSHDDLQNKLYMYTQIQRSNEPTQIIKDKNIIKTMVINNKKINNVLDPADFAIDNDLDIDVLMEVIKELCDTKQLVLDNDIDSHLSEELTGLVTDKSKIRQLLFNNKKISDTLDPADFAIDNGLDIDVLMEVIDKLRDEKHLVYV